MFVFLSGNVILYMSIRFVTMRVSKTIGFLLVLEHLLLC